MCQLKNSDRLNFHYKDTAVPISGINCPSCGNNIKVRRFIDANGNLVVMTPRIYSCSRCSHIRLFFFRDDRRLRSCFISKYEYIDPLDYISNYDPIKYYLKIAKENPNQLSII